MVDNDKCCICGECCSCCPNLEVTVTPPVVVSDHLFTVTVTVKQGEPQGTATVEKLGLNDASGFAADMKVVVKNAGAKAPAVAVVAGTAGNDLSLATDIGGSSVLAPAATDTDYNATLAVMGQWADENDPTGAGYFVLGTIEIVAGVGQAQFSMTLSGSVPRTLHISIVDCGEVGTDEETLCGSGSVVVTGEPKYPVAVYITGGLCCPNGYRSLEIQAVDAYGIRVFDWREKNTEPEGPEWYMANGLEDGCQPVWVYSFASPTDDPYDVISKCDDPPSYGIGTHRLIDPDDEVYGFKCCVQFGGGDTWCDNPLGTCTDEDQEAP